MRIDINSPNKVGQPLLSLIEQINYAKLKQKAQNFYEKNEKKLDYESIICLI